MKALLDLSLPPKLTKVFAECGYRAFHAHDLGLEQATDLEILSYARKNGQLLVTACQDLPRFLALASAEGPGLILFRGGIYTDAEMGDLIQQVLTGSDALLLDRSICVVDQKQVRVTRLPVKRDLR